MKKKIKDLTLKEVHNLCYKHLIFSKGVAKVNCDSCKYSLNFECKLDYHHLNKYGNEKIEVEDDEKEN